MNNTERRDKLSNIMEQGGFIGSVVPEIEKVRVKELLYLIFSFDQLESNLLVKEAKDNPYKNDKHIIKKEEELIRRFEEFKETVKRTGCCYAIFDFETALEDGAPRSVLFLVVYIPDGIGVRERFLYSSNVQKIVDHIKVAVKQIQINRFEDLTYENLKQMCLSLKKG
ncbi:cofilin [Nematocida sp. LUAm3]|nr:cofilin [Nematocida sp. LUAm3]KAI5174559.1 cofilin [Nematocida sp. LUAm2]KAI5178035.1 cofilin [Nematocida sp. LUAm1]